MVWTCNTTSGPMTELLGCSLKLSEPVRQHYNLSIMRWATRSSVISRDTAEVDILVQAHTQSHYNEKLSSIWEPLRLVNKVMVAVTQAHKCYCDNPHTCQWLWSLSLMYGQCFVLAVEVCWNYEGLFKGDRSMKGHLKKTAWREGEGWPLLLQYANDLVNVAKWRHIYLAIFSTSEGRYKMWYIQSTLAKTDADTTDIWI